MGCVFAFEGRKQNLEADTSEIQYLSAQGVLTSARGRALPDGDCGGLTQKRNRERRRRTAAGFFAFWVLPWSGSCRAPRELGDAFTLSFRNARTAENGPRVCSGSFGVGIGETPGLLWFLLGVF